MKLGKDDDWFADLLLSTMGSDSAVDSFSPIYSSLDKFATASAATGSSITSAADVWRTAKVSLGSSLDMSKVESALTKLKVTGRPMMREDLAEHTLKTVVARWPEVCSREVQAAKGKGWARSFREEINHILHTSNFRRVEYGYMRHAAYQAELDRASNNWTQVLHDELIEHLENPDPTPEQLSARRRISELNRKAEIERAAERKRQNELAHARFLIERAEKYSDAPDNLPPTLLDELYGVGGSAKQGSW
jgi:hypothetical protein